MVSITTIYNWSKSKLLKYNTKPKSKSTENTKKEKVEYKQRKEFLEGREYEEFHKYIKDHPKINIVEMDLVIGKQDGGGAILTFFMPKLQFMLGYKIKSKDSYEILKVFDEIEAKIGTRTFRKLFGCILTDQGGEFQRSQEICTSKITLGVRTKIFYCKPSSPYQKPNVENVHLLLRKVFPKNCSIKDVTTEDVQEVVSNINSLKKLSLKGKTPNELFIKAFGKNLLNKLSLRVYADEDVILLKFNKLKD